MVLDAVATPLVRLATRRRGDVDRLTDRLDENVVEASRRLGRRAAFTAVGALVAGYARGWRLDVSGTEHLPSEGPAILAANHLSFVDSPLLMYRLPRRVWMLGKADYLDSPLTARLFPALGMIPLDRSGGKAAVRALRAGVGVLEAGRCLGIFPEGTRSRSGDLHRGHTGLAWLAFRSGAPILPVGIRGTDRVHDPDSRLPRWRGQCSIAIGEPVTIDRYGRGNKRDQRNLTDDVMFEITQLSGQRYVDAYAR